MAESAIGLQGDVERPIPESDVRAQRGLGSGLPTDVFFLGHVVAVTAVGLLLEPLAMGQIEHAKGLSHHLKDRIARPMEARSAERTYAFDVGSGKIFAVKIAIERDESVALDRKSTRLNSSHANISYAVFCLKKKKQMK